MAFPVKRNHMNHKKMSFVHISGENNEVRFIYRKTIYTLDTHAVYFSNMHEQKELKRGVQDKPGFFCFF